MRSGSAGAPPGAVVGGRVMDPTAAGLVLKQLLARSENVRRIWPFLRDRRIDAYDDLLKRFRD